MKRVIVLLFVFLGVVGCSQTKKDMNTINSSNFVEKVAAEVKHYNVEPTYWLRINKEEQLEVYVNDMPVYKDFSDEDYGKSEPINYMILKSGEQRIKYKVYSKKPEVYIELGVYTLDNADKNKDAKTITTYQKTIKMPSSGVYEDEFVFTANVPYHNKGWTEGQDLTKFDKQELEQAVVAYYQKMWNIYNNNSKKEELFPLIFNREREIAVSQYYSRGEYKEVFHEILKPYEDPTYQMQPLKDYKLVFYGNGKAVSLEQNSMDLLLRGESAFWAKFKTDKGANMMYATTITLYLPKGKSLEDGLEAIR